MLVVELPRPATVAYQMRLDGKLDVTLKRTPDGKLRLEAAYDARWQGYSRVNSVVLEKK